MTSLHIVPDDGSEPGRSLDHHPCPGCGARGWLYASPGGELQLVDLVAAMSGMLLLRPSGQTVVDPTLSCLACGWTDHAIPLRRPD